MTKDEIADKIDDAKHAVAEAQREYDKAQEALEDGKTHAMVEAIAIELAAIGVTVGWKGVERG